MPDDDWVAARAAALADESDRDPIGAYLVTLGWALSEYGYPLPERDPARERKRQRAAANTRVLDGGRE